MVQGPSQESAEVSYSVTDQDLEVLRHFLSRPEDYSAYATQIEKETGRRISRVWAKKVCDKLVDRNILGFKLRLPRRRKEKTKHYFLKHDIRSFYTVARVFLKEAPPPHDRLFLITGFCDRMLTEDMVRQVLADRKVEIRRIVSRDSGSTPHGRHWAIRFPVVPSYVLRDRRLEMVKAANRGGSEIPSHGELSNVSDAHYANWEAQNIVLPILCLCQTSPSALAHFLFGQWGAFSREGTIDYSRGGTSMINHLLFRLIFKAIADISDERRIMAGAVQSAVVRPGRGGSPSDDVLLILNLNRGDEILYDCGFDTEPLVYGDEMGDMCEAAPMNPENCWVRIRYKELHRQPNAVD